MTLVEPIRDWSAEFLQTVFRFAPWPTQTGLRRIGDPDDQSPVLLTGNYDLTVRRLVRAMRGRDAWLLVAPSGGINVWCAAAGGHLSTHQVVTALKTSGIAERVKHRRIVLPQLAATGVTALEVFRRARWKVDFGPVSASDLPEYLETGEKTDAMRRVRFELRDRLEMAVMWGAPASLAFGGLALCLRPSFTLALVAGIAAMSVVVFTAYDRMGAYRRVLLFAGSTVLAIPVVYLAGGGVTALVAAAVAPGIIGALLTYDYEGSTPLEGGSHFEGKHWTITLDAERCKGVYRCWEVCPEACFEKLEDLHKIELAHDERCVRCGACVVQCPQDALFFEDEAGERIEPAVIRKFKLNLLGRRTIDAD